MVETLCCRPPGNDEKAYLLIQRLPCQAIRSHIQRFGLIGEIFTFSSKTVFSDLKGDVQFLLPNEKVYGYVTRTVDRS